jgi:hypothetical protein
MLQGETHRRRGGIELSRRYARLKRRITRRGMITFAVGVIALVLIGQWSPTLAGLLVIGLVMGGLAWVFPAVLDTEVHGPGHQYRDDSSKRP